MANLRQIYQKNIIPKLKDELKLKNQLAVPQVEKIIINSGIGKEATSDPKFLEIATADLAKICGQKPKIIKAMKAISGFKLKIGAPVGLVVTLRKKRMYDFLDKLINIVFPRIRDFRGVKKSALDKFGNLNLGLSEHIAFPEIKPEQVLKPFGMQINIVTKAKNRREALALFKALGIIFEV